MSVKHKFTCLVADDPTAVAGGLVVPTNWNAEHDITVTSGAGAPATAPTYVGQTYIDTTNLITYTAFGIATSTDWIPAIVIES